MDSHLLILAVLFAGMAVLQIGFPGKVRALAKASPEKYPDWFIRLPGLLYAVLAFVCFGMLAGAF